MKTRKVLLNFLNLDQKSHKYLKIMKNRKKILVLSGLKKDLDSTIKSAVGIAKIMDAEIDFFYVKKPTEIVDKESQLSAMRTINREQIKVEKQVKSLIEPYISKYKTKINHRFAFGNVKNEIKDYIEISKPDVVVLGKRKSNPFKLGGDKITDFILNSFPGTVLIASRTNTLEPQKELSIGILNSDDELNSKEGLKKIVEHTEFDFKSFRIINKGSNLNREDFFKNNSTEYVFEKNENTVSKLTDYLEKSKVNLLYMNRSTKESKNTGVNVIPLKEIINKVDVPILLSN